MGLRWGLNELLIIKTVIDIYWVFTTWHALVSELTTTLEGKHKYQLEFKDEETKAQKG